MEMFSLYLAALSLGLLFMYCASKVSEAFSKEEDDHGER